jgi:hypothetical protein
MDPSILGDSCGENFELAAIVNLKRKMRVTSKSFRKKKILKMEGGRRVETLLRQEH